MQELSPNTTVAHYRIIAKLGAGRVGDPFILAL